MCKTCSSRATTGHSHSRATNGTTTPTARACRPCAREQRVENQQGFVQVMHQHQPARRRARRALASRRQREPRRRRWGRCCCRRPAVVGGPALDGAQSLPLAAKILHAYGVARESGRGFARAQHAHTPQPRTCSSWSAIAPCDSGRHTKLKAVLCAALRSNPAHGWRRPLAPTAARTHVAPCCAWLRSRRMQSTAGPAGAQCCGTNHMHVQTCVACETQPLAPWRAQAVVLCPRTEACARPTPCLLVGQYVLQQRELG